MRFLRCLRNCFTYGALGLTLLASASAAEIQLHAPDTVLVGAAVPVELRVSAVTDLYAWQLDL